MFEAIKFGFWVASGSFTTAPGHCIDAHIVMVARRTLETDKTASGKREDSGILAPSAKQPALHFSTTRRTASLQESIDPS